MGTLGQELEAVARSHIKERLTYNELVNRLLEELKPYAVHVDSNYIFYSPTSSGIMQTVYLRTRGENDIVLTFPALHQLKEGV